MKVEERQAVRSSEQNSREPRGRFAEVVKDARKEPAGARPTPGGIPPKTSTVGTRPFAVSAVTARLVKEAKTASLEVNVETLTRARTGANVESDRLIGVRTELHQSREEKVQARAIELIRRELEHSAPGVPEPRLTAPEPVPGAGESKSAGEGLVLDEAGATAERRETGGSERTAETVNTAAAIELVERIEVFVRSGRPGLTLKLSEGSFAGQAELVRSAPGEVSVTLQGGRGKLALGDVQRLQEELASRGIRLGAVRWQGGEAKTAFEAIRSP